MQVQHMDGVDQLGLSFAYLDLNFCADVGGIRPDDEVTDENKVRVHVHTITMFTVGYVCSVFCYVQQYHPTIWVVFIFYVLFSSGSRSKFLSTLFFVLLL